jgi:hypothetical protein
MSIQAPPLYQKYHIDRDDERDGLFRVLAGKYPVQNALYAGSYVHITPSFILPAVTYVDSYKKARLVFEDPKTLDYINSRKEYAQDASVQFILADFTEELNLPEQGFDLLISQYAGLISYHCKKYLKPGGMLVANNSHGDASMAYLDPGYELRGVINKRGDRFAFSDQKLEEYFVPKKGVQTTKEALFKTMKGIGYTKSAGNYVFARSV